MQSKKINFFYLILIISLFLSIPLLLVFQYGLFCYDDIGYAIVAKNFDNGLGYATTINYVGSHFAVSPFDYALGQGPIGILPVALAFKLFGFNPLLPGLVQVCLEFILLVLIAWFAFKEYYFIRTACFLFLSFLLITFISGWHYEHWYAMLGESIAALFIVLGFIVLNRGDESSASYVMAGLFLGLAVLTKEISAIFVAIFSLYVFIKVADSYFTKQTDQKNEVKKIFYFSVSGLVPFVIFELWRFLSLGIRGFFDNWKHHISFVSSYSPYNAINKSFHEILIGKIALLKEHFYISIITISAIMMFAFVLCKFEKNKPAISVFFFAIISYFSYWLFFSTGPARHLYIGIITLCFFVSLPVLVQKNIFIGALPALLLFIFLVPAGGTHFLKRIKEVENGFLSKQGCAQYLAEYDMLSYIEKNFQNTKIGTPWWAHVAMLEFLSQRGALFSGWDDPKQRKMRFIVLNATVSALTPGEIEKNKAVLAEKKCNVMYKASPYTLYMCAN